MGGQEAKIWTWPWFYALILNATSSAMMMPILQILLFAFSCEPHPSATSTVDYTLQYHREITCWEGWHFLYIGCSLVAVMLYYPLCSFMVPLMQFADTALDIKYDSVFLLLF